MNKTQWNNLSFGEKAWKLGLVMQYMNDEEAYYSGWLYIWPDGETYQDCLYDFEDEENYKDLERSFIAHYSDKEAHNAGLYSCRGVPNEVIEVAHFWDDQLGLKRIEVVK